MLRSTINPQDANSGVMGTDSSMAGRVQALKMGSLMIFSQKKAFNEERFLLKAVMINRRCNGRFRLRHQSIDLRSQFCRLPLHWRW